MKSWLIIAILLIGTFVVRLYKIDIPIADWHSWRQADTAAVARNFVEDGFHLFRPTYDDLSSLQTGRPNPQGLRLVEFPLYNAMIGLVYLITGVNEMSARLVSVLFATTSTFLLYLLIRRLMTERVAVLSAAFYAFLPYNIYFTRSIFPEVPAVTFLLAAYLAFAYWMEVKKKSSLWIFGVLSTVLGAVALLVKPTTIFFFLPFVWFAWKKYEWSMIRRLELWTSGLTMVLPLVLWRWWISHFPEGIPASEWLLNGQNIRFTGAFFRWIFAERFGKLIMTGWGMPLFILGLIRGRLKDDLFPYALLVGTLLYVTVFAMGNIQHDYYQILIIPTLAIFLGRGADFLLSPPPSLSKVWTMPILAVCLVAIAAFGWYEIRGNYQINHWEIVEAGRAVDQLTPKDAKVIAPYFGDTAFLYQTKRKGWPIMDSPIDTLIARGATHYVSVQFDDVTKQLMQKYPIVTQTEKYIILDLNP
ncbi:MAG: glycosyltransferase family 39 protein [bacterium]|nr:glycosyltransferase family 39 protein [bacterium]